MKKFFSFIIVCALCLSAGAQRNLAVRLDGADNNLRIGMDTLCHHWTLEAWIKADTTSWKDMEVIIGGGEYGKQNISDHLPLVIRKGYLYNAGADLQGTLVPMGKWVHVAASCDGRSTLLFLNGKEVARKDTATSILPGAIGVDEDGETVFKGDIDEVRVWGTGLNEKEISGWMNGRITSRHPKFGDLRGYYTFDDLEDDMSVNRVGKGYLSHHVRNGRVKQYGKTALAFAVENDNPAFHQEPVSQELFNAVTLYNEWDADQGTRDYQVLKLRVIVDGKKKPLSLKELTLDLSACTSFEDIEKVHVYYTGQKPRTREKTELFGDGVSPRGKIRLKGTGFTLRPGVNYFLVTFDISPQAQLGHRLRADVSSFKLNGKRIVPESDTKCLDAEVTACSSSNPAVLKVLQWNIWHGGVHLGKDGRQRVLELIRRTHADVVLMQEGYGAQQMIADSLGYRLQTASMGDNLALYSRYPLEKLPTKKTFQSNPAILTLPGGKKIYVNDCWLRYAYRPEYGCVYGNKGLNPEGWVAEDSILPLKDIRYIVENDIAPHITKGMPVIITGDFNSGSHLDWTRRAAFLHNGYSAENLPTSRYMKDQGFSDSFREMHPDEVERGEGTFAVVFGNLQHSRLDFIYYRGKGIRPLSSKIVRTTAEIDDVWPSDHAGVLTTFQITD